MIAALQLFSERDYASVTIKDIGDRVGVNTALLYYYFDDKEALFRASLEYAVKEAMERYRLFTDRHSEPADLINDWFETHYQLAEPIRQLVKIIYDYSSSRTQMPIIDVVIAQFYDEEANNLSAKIHEGMANGTFRIVDAKRVAHFASTHLDGIMVRSIIQKDFDLRVAIDTLKEVFWQYLGVDGRKPSRSRRTPTGQIKVQKRGARAGGKNTHF